MCAHQLLDVPQLQGAALIADGKERCSRAWSYSYNRRRLPIEHSAAVQRNEAGIARRRRRIATTFCAVRHPSIVMIYLIGCLRSGSATVAHYVRRKGSVGGYTRQRSLVSSR